MTEPSLPTASLILCLSGYHQVILLPWILTFFGRALEGAPLGQSGLCTLPPGKSASSELGDWSFSDLKFPQLLPPPQAPLSSTENFLQRNGGGGGGGFIFGLSWLRSYGSSGVLLYRGNVASNVFMLIQTSVSTFFKPPYKALKFKPESTASVSSPRPEGTLQSADFCRMEASFFFLKSIYSFFSLTK